jgi:hypothetical protein
VTGCSLYSLGSEILICKVRESFERFSNKEELYPSVEESEYELRKLIWLNHGCSVEYLYGDDGELQCHKCRIDFKRDSVFNINQRFSDLMILKLKNMEVVNSLNKDSKNGKESKD